MPLGQRGEEMNTAATQRFILNVSV